MRAHALWLVSLVAGCSLFGSLDDLSQNTTAEDAGKCVPGGDCAACETCVAYCGCADPDTFSECVAACPTGTGGAAGSSGSAGSAGSGGAAGVGGAGGTGGAGGAGGAGGTGGTYADSGTGNPCNDCVFTLCNQEYVACGNDPDCVALVDCLNFCSGDPACFDACATTHANGVPEYNALGACAAANCPQECGG